MPDLRAGEIRVANRGAALNPVDWKLIASVHHPGWRPDHLSRRRRRWQITAAGEGVNLAVGTRIAYHQDLLRSGSFAQVTTLRAHCALVVREGTSNEGDASLPCPGLSVVQAVVTVPSAPQVDLLVSDAGGAFGLLVVQLALRRGWRVRAVPRRDTRRFSNSVWRRRSSTVLRRGSTTSNTPRAIGVALPPLISRAFDSLSAALAELTRGSARGKVLIRI
ncbi:hypothetical protein [Paraburkholderia terrae]|uniref:hypothetical protein n=1 Tax=Paraburkholderia terrae TaxID=311230 RepID=UPI0020BEAFCE|nr:hypothetical protein [Paraburkholderia terrae]